MIKIVTWNMCYWQHRKSFLDSWDFLCKKVDPDIAMIQETVPSSASTTLKNYVWTAIGKNRKWGSGIFSKYPVEEIKFDNSYPGSVIAGEIALPDSFKLTVVSIHVLLEHGYSIVPLHRIFSDLTLLLEGKKGKRDIVIGGDFNASVQFDKKQVGQSHRIFFERVENFGLFDCLQKFHDRPVQTYRHNKGDEQWQLDYIFLSRRLEDKLKKCYVYEESDVFKLSDHNPVVAHLSLP